MVLAERYRLIRRHEDLGTGEFWGGVDQETGSEVWVCFSDQPGLGRIAERMREWKAAAVPRILDSGEVRLILDSRTLGVAGAQGRAATHVEVVVEFAVQVPALGKPLPGRFARRPLAPAEALALVALLAGGLEEGLEAGYSHGWLSAGSAWNLRRRICLVDLAAGLAKPDSAAIEMAAQVSGYFAPERISGGGASEAADVFALGWLLYASLVGLANLDGYYRELVAEAGSLSTAELLALWRGQSREHVRTLLPEGSALAVLLLGALAERPADRPTLAEFRIAAGEAGRALAGAAALVAYLPRKRAVAEAAVLGAAAGVVAADLAMGAGAGEGAGTGAAADAGAAVAGAGAVGAVAAGAAVGAVVGATAVLAAESVVGESIAAENGASSESAATSGTAAASESAAAGAGMSGSEVASETAAMSEGAETASDAETTASGGGAAVGVAALAAGALAVGALAEAGGAGAGGAGAVGTEAGAVGAAGLAGGAGSAAGDSAADVDSAGGGANGSVGSEAANAVGSGAAKSAAGGGAEVSYVESGGALAVAERRARPRLGIGLLALIAVGLLAIGLGGGYAFGSSGSSQNTASTTTLANNAGGSGAVAVSTTGLACAPGANASTTAGVNAAAAVGTASSTPVSAASSAAASAAVSAAVSASATPTATPWNAEAILPVPTSTAGALTQLTQTVQGAESSGLISQHTATTLQGEITAIQHAVTSGSGYLSALQRLSRSIQSGQNQGTIPQALSVQLATTLSYLYGSTGS